MPLSERGWAIYALLERDLPSRKIPKSFAEKLDFLDRLKRAIDEYQRVRHLESVEREKS